MVRNAFAETLIVTHWFVSGMKKRFLCRFGTKRRFVLWFEKDTWCPEMGRFPVSWHTFDIADYI